MAEPIVDVLVVCPKCGQDTPQYEDCVMCGHPLRDPTAQPRDLSEDEMQKMMADAKVEEIKAKRQILLHDAWDHAPYLDRLQRLAQIAPNNPKLHYYIGAAHTEMGEHRKAIVSYTRALIADPKMADAFRRRGDSQYILVPVLSGDVQAYYDRALGDYETALSLEPDVYTYNIHGSVIASLGRIEEAVQEYELAVRLDPSYPETYFNRGYAFKMLGETDLAVADFQKFLSFDGYWNQELVFQAQSYIKEMTEPQ